MAWTILAAEDLGGWLTPLSSSDAVTGSDGTSPGIALAAAEVGSATENVAVALSDSDPGTGVDAVALITVVASDAGTNADSVALIGVSGTDPGAVAASTSIAATLSIQTDSETGADTASIAVNDSDAGTAVEVTALITVTDADQGYGSVGNPGPTNISSHIGGNNPGAVAVQFTARTSTLESVSLWVQNPGAGVTGNVYVDITDGTVTGTVLATSAQIAASSLTTTTPTNTNATTFTFGAPVQLTVGNTYWIRLQRTTVGDQATDYIGVYFGTQQFPSHSAASFNGTTWGFFGAGKIYAFRIPEWESNPPVILVTDSGAGSESAALALTGSDSGSLAATASITLSDSDAGAIAEAVALALAGTDAGVLGYGVWPPPTFENLGLASNIAVGVAFVAPDSLDRVTVTLKNNNLSTDQLYAEIVSGSISGTVIATSSLVNGSSVTTTNLPLPVTFVFPSSLGLTKGTTYYLRIHRTAAADGVHYYDIGAFAAGSNYYTYDGATWNATSGATLAYLFPEAEALTPAITVQTDSGTAGESSSIALVDSETGVNADTFALSASIIDADSGTFSEAQALAVALSVTDSATVSESTAIAVTTQDSATGTDVGVANLVQINKMPPDAILAMTNLTGVLSSIQDDPDAADANWLVAAGAGDLRVSFATPSAALLLGAGHQEIRVQVRAP